jgi:hypothetical protein
MKTLDCDKDLIRQAHGFPGASTFVTYRWRDPSTCGQVEERMTERKARRNHRRTALRVALAAIAAWVCGPVMRSP